MKKKDYDEDDSYFDEGYHRSKESRGEYRSSGSSTKQESREKNKDEEEDPLDAFMAGIDQELQN